MALTMEEPPLPVAWLGRCDSRLRTVSLTSPPGATSARRSCGSTRIGLSSPHACQAFSLSGLRQCKHERYQDFALKFI